MVTRTYKSLLAVIGVGLGVGGFAPAVSADPVANKDLCKGGGFAQPPLDVLGFKNQGQCIKFFNQGGTVPNPGGGGYGGAT